MEGVPRGLLGRIQHDLATTPAVLLEGLRAVGKTWLAHELVDSGHLRTFVDLTDDYTLEGFRDDPSGSLSEVVTPAVIDEVQLVPGLLLAIKRIIDAKTTNGTFLLTGSARVHSDDLGGTDPLVGRIARSRLRPLTQAERAGNPIDLVARIFGGRLSPGTYPAVSRRELRSRIAIGGLPTVPGVLSLGGGRARLQRQADYVERTLAPQFGLPRRDEAGLARAFRYFAGNSSQILVVERAASQLGINRKTVDAYLDDLEARFLIERLPAWRPTASAAARAHPKLHVTDAGIASAVASPAFGGHETDARFGGRVESFVVMELLAQAAWGDLGIEAFHWRDPSSKNEVDLVLVDSENRAVAIEVKASTSASKHDLRGIDAFAEQRPLARGVVLYSGPDLRLLAPDRWAVPITALWTDLARSAPEQVGSAAAATGRTGAPSAPSSTEEMAVQPDPDPLSSTSDAALFLSYVHADDDAEYGRIVALADDIALRYELLTGEPLRVFTDRDIAWGEQWKLRLSQELVRTTFFVPVVTPRFLVSRSCRNEALEFVAKARALGFQEFVMPIIYLPTPGLDDESDPVAKAIGASQWKEWGDLRYRERTSGAYRQAVDELVEHLRSVRNTATRSPEGVEVSTTGGREGDDDVEGGEQEGDVLGLAESAFELVPALEERVASLLSSFVALTQRLDEIAPSLERAGRSPSPRQIRSVLRDAVEPLREPIGIVEEEAQQTTRLLTELDEVVSSTIVACENTATRRLVGLDDFLHSILELDDIDFDVSEMDEVRAMTRSLASVAREMRPVANSVDSILRVLTDFDAMRRRWVTDAQRVLGLPSL